MLVFSKISHSGNSSLFLHFMPVWCCSWPEHHPFCVSVLQTHVLKCLLDVCFRMSALQIPEGDFATDYLRPIAFHGSRHGAMVPCHFTPNPSHPYFFLAPLSHIYTAKSHPVVLWSLFSSLSTQLKSQFTVSSFLPFCSK